MRQLCLGLILFFIASFNSICQVVLPNDTSVTCKTDITIHPLALNSSPCTGTYQITSIAYDSNVFTNNGTPAFTSLPDDKYSDLIDIPFCFSFFGHVFSNAIIAANGYLSFDLSKANSYSPWQFSTSAPSSALPINSIFGVYHDIDQSISGQILYRIEGVSPYRRFIVEFSQSALFNCNSLFSTTAIILYESKNIIDVQIQHKALCSTWNSGNSLLGIQDSSGTTAFVPPSRNTGPWSANYEAWRFSPNEPSDSSYLTWYVNDIVAGTGDTLVINDVDTTMLIRVDLINTCSGLPVLSNSDEMTVMVATNMQISPTDTTLCFGDSLQISVSGVTEAIWSTGDTALQIDVVAQNDSLLLVWSYDSAGCTHVLQSEITVNPLLEMPIMQISSTDTTLCYGDSLQISVSGVTEAFWSTGDTALQVNVVAQNDSLLLVWSYDSAGCMHVLQSEITVYPLPGMPIMQISPTDTTLCYGDSLQISVSGVTEAFWSTGDTALQIDILAQNDSSLLVWSYDSSGCSHVLQSDITVNPLPDTPILTWIPQLTTISSSVPDVFWFHEDTLVWWANTDSLFVFANGSFYAVNMDGNGCSATSELIEVTNLSVNDIYSPNNVNVFPNPNNGLFSICSYTPFDNATVAIFNSQGRKLLHRPIQGNCQDIDMRGLGLSVGIYFILIENGNSYQRYPFILSK